MVRSTSRSRSGSRKPPAKPPEPELAANQTMLKEKIQELAMPVMEKYGVEAFDELVARYATVMDEFKEEVEQLFQAMVEQSREEQGQLKSLLRQGEEDVEADDEDLDTSGMSEYERRLEEMEKEQGAEDEAEDEEDSD